MGETFDQLYLTVAPLLRRVAIRKFNIPRSDAEPLVHDVFMTYLTNPSSVRGDLHRYLIGGICNASRKYWWLRKRQEEVFDDLDEDYMIAEDDVLFDGVAQNLVIAAVLSRVGRRCREALQRYYLDEEPTPEIAAALNTSCGNVNYIVHVCRKRAREVYEELTRVP